MAVFRREPFEDAANLVDNLGSSWEDGFVPEVPSGLERAEMTFFRPAVPFTDADII